MDPARLLTPQDAAVAAEALREAAHALSADNREDSTHARAIEFLRRRAEVYERIAAAGGNHDRA